ncbi:MAG: hypothetical protein ABUL44_02315 [Flavobacterium sp.]
MKYLFILLLSFSSAQSFCQIYAYKAFEVMAKKCDDLTPIKENNWAKVEFDIVVNLDNAKISLYSNPESEITITRALTRYTKDGYPHLMYMGVDQQGENCVVTFIRYGEKDNIHKATIILDYKDVSFSYRLTKSE